VNVRNVRLALSDRAAVSNEGIKDDTAGSAMNMIAARLSPGAISESSSSHLAGEAGDVSTRAVEPCDDVRLWCQAWTTQLVQFGKELSSHRIL
jgi:hypothetical protein